MARKTISIGQQGNDGTGDSIREAFRKVNENFQDLYAVFGSGAGMQFTDLDDAPVSYEAGQVFITTSSSANNGGQIETRYITGGDGVSVTTNDDQIIIASSAGLNSAAPRLNAGLNANQFPIANVPTPDDIDIQDKLDAWNIVQVASGDTITLDDLLITKGYADSRYKVVGSSEPLVVRSTPATNAQFVKTINGYNDGDVISNAHGLTASDTGTPYVYSTAGTAATPLVSGSTYYIRHINSSTVSLHTDKAGADQNINRVDVTTAGAGVQLLTHADFDSTLSGNWLSTEALPRKEVVRRSGDTMTGPLTLSGAPTVNLHAASKQYVDSTVAAGVISVSNTDALIEGVDHLFFTDVRAAAAGRAALSVVDASGDGSISYNPLTGVFTYTGPSAAEVYSHFTAGVGVYLLNGDISIGQNVAPNASPTFVNVTANVTGNVTGSAGTVSGAIQTAITEVGTLTNLNVSGNVVVTGDLRVNGTTTTVNSTSVSVDDPVITLGGDLPPVNNDGKDRGVEFRWHNGTASRVGFFGFKRQNNTFTFIPDATNAGEVFSGAVGTIAANLDGNVTGNVSGNAGTVSSIADHSADQLVEGTTNLFFTDARVYSSAKDIIQAGTNITVSSNDTNQTITIAANSVGGYNFNNNKTDDLSETGSINNFWFTKERTHDSFNIGYGIALDSADGNGRRTLRSTISQYTHSDVHDAFTIGAGLALAPVDGFGRREISSEITQYTHSDVHDAFTIGAGLALDDADVDGRRAIRSTITQYTNSLAQGAISVDNVGVGFGSISKTGGLISYIPVTNAEIKSVFTGGVGINITQVGSTYSLSVDQDIFSTDTSFNNTMMALRTGDLVEGAGVTLHTGPANLWYTDTRVQTVIDSQVSASPVANKIVKRDADGASFNVMSVQSISISTGTTQTLAKADITGNILNIVGGNGSRIMRMPDATLCPGYNVIVCNINGPLEIRNSTGSLLFSSIIGGQSSQLICNGNDWIVTWTV